MRAARPSPAWVNLQLRSAVLRVAEFPSYAVNNSSRKTLRPGGFGGTYRQNVNDNRLSW